MSDSEFDYLELDFDDVQSQHSLCDFDDFNSLEVFSSLRYASHNIPIREPRVPRMPQEVVDQVIDHLHDDMKALRACSLVCRAWTPASSVHLFTTLFWPPCYHAWLAWHATVQDMQCTCYSINYSRVWQQLVEFCRDSDRLRCNQVRRLNLCFAVPFEPSNASGDASHMKAHPIQVSELEQLLNCLPGLRHLYLTDLDFVRSEQRIPPWSSLTSTLYNAPKNLERLTINNPHFDFTDELVDEFFRLFNTISTLEMSNLKHEASSRLSSHSMDQARKKGCVVHSLEVKDAETRPLQDCLVALQHWVDLNSLTSAAFLTNAYAPGSLEKVLKHAPNLASLSVNAAATPNLSLIVSVCPSLRSLTLCGELVVHAGDCVSLDSVRCGWTPIVRVLLSMPVLARAREHVALDVRTYVGMSRAPFAGRPRSLESNVRFAFRGLRATPVQLLAQRFKSMRFLLLLRLTFIGCANGVKGSQMRNGLQDRR